MKQPPRHDYVANAVLPAIPPSDQERSWASMCTEGSRKLLEAIRRYDNRHRGELLSGHHGARGLIAACAIVLDSQR